MNKIFIIWFLILCSSTFGQISPIEDKANLKKFLNEFVSDHNKQALEKGGIGVQFTGNFESLPVDLENSLSENFPNHKFAIANMLYFHYTGYSVKLILVSEIISHKVTAYAWNLPFSGVSDSFRKILSNYQASSEKDALAKVKVLSRLLVYTGNGNVGEIKYENGKISSELFYEYSGKKEPFRILKVDLDKDFQFGKIELINPVDNKEGSEIF